MGSLAGLNESLAIILAPRPPVASQQEERLEDAHDTAMLDALNALVTAVNSITIPEVRIEFDSAVKTLVKAVNGIKLPEAKPVDLTPIVEAISKIELEVEFPEPPKPLEPMEPCAYTFTVVRDSRGLMAGVIATPGISEINHSTATYE